MGSRIILESGIKCRCTSQWPWKSPFIGIVEKVYRNSVLVRIVSTSLADDYLVWEKKGRTVVSKKNIEIVK